MTTTPNCPRCGSNMKQRTNRRDGSQFFGCSQYPKCKATLPMTAAAKDASHRVNPSAKRISDAMASEEQAAVFGHDLTDSHLMVDAKAGTGKTTTCLEKLMRLAEAGRLGRTLFAAFNKAIAIEIADKVQQAGIPVEVRTLHSLGLSVLRSATATIQIASGNDKHHAIMDRLGYDVPNGKDSESRKLAAERRVIRRETGDLVSIAKNTLVSKITSSSVSAIMMAYGKDWKTPIEELASVAQQALDEHQQQQTFIDFDDMIWQPIVLNHRMPKFDLLVVDEVQDLNAAQHALVERMVTNGSRAMVVGDPNQSIYAFRGALSDSMDRLQALLQDNGGVTVLPLNTTRRCPRTVVELARQLVPEYRAAENAPEGDVRSMSESKALQAMTPGDDLVLCRTNAPLTKAALQLVRLGKRPVIRGREFGNTLVAMIRGFKARTVTGLINAIERHRASEHNRLLDNEGARESMDDQCDALIALTEGAETVQEVVARVESVFDDTDPSNGITLSTVHRAKGLESHRVMILEPKLLGRRRSTPADTQQERNIEYVAYTRAQQTLVFIDDNAVADADDGVD